MKYFVFQGVDGTLLSRVACKIQTVSLEMLYALKNLDVKYF